MIVQAVRRDPAFFRRRSLARRVGRWIRANAAASAWAVLAVLVWGSLCFGLLLLGVAR
jgi:uncharacterized membrane protein YdfJ with MMPL/SSD domain